MKRESFLGASPCLFRWGVGGKGWKAIGPSRVYGHEGRMFPTSVYNKEKTARHFVMEAKGGQRERRR